MLSPTGSLTRNEGERKFSMNQNLTLLFVLRKTLRIMIDTNRYNREEVQKALNEGGNCHLPRTVAQKQR
jgi:hypothetical protein